MLRLEAVEAAYDGTQVLWGVSLEAKADATTVIVGPNGAGKSTVLNVVDGLLAPSAGHVFFKGQEITRLAAHARPERGIAACPEGRRLFPQLTAEGNLRLGAYTRRARKEAVKAARLSGGEQQMVGIGRALMAKPDLLVLDEPSLGLAPKVVTEIFETIRRLRESGLAVLAVEQNAYQALRVADYGYVMQEGRVAKEGPPAELLDLEALRRSYFAIS